MILYSEHQSVSNEKLRYSHDTTTGYITDYTPANRKRGGYIGYRFTLNGKTYENDKSYDTVYDYMTLKLMHVPLTIIYQKGDTDNNQILLRKWEYIKYGLSVPDTISSLDH